MVNQGWWEVEEWALLMLRMVRSPTASIIIISHMFFYSHTDEFTSIHLRKNTTLLATKTPRVCAVCKAAITHYVEVRDFSTFYATKLMFGHPGTTDTHSLPTQILQFNCTSILPFSRIPQTINTLGISQFSLSADGSQRRNVFLLSNLCSVG